MPSTGALMLLTALHTCDQVGGHGSRPATELTVAQKWDSAADPARYPGGWVPGRPSLSSLALPSRFPPLWY